MNISLPLAPQKTHQLTYDVDDETSSVYTTSSLNDQLDVKQDEESSTESDQISKWVDHEIRKIKRNLSKEIAAKESLRNIGLNLCLYCFFLICLRIYSLRENTSLDQAK